LQHSEEIAAAVISTVSDSVQISEIEEGLPVRHYITGKTWDWGASPEYNFIESMNAFGTALDNARLIYKK
jgi:hypothetical protein